MPEGNKLLLDNAPNQKPAPVGPTVGIVIIVGLLLVGAVYFLFQQIEQKKNVEPPSYIPGDQT